MAREEAGRKLAVYCEAPLIVIMIMIINFIVAIAEVYKNEGNDEYKKNHFNNAIQFYTEGIKVNCKDEELNAILYSNRAAARFNLGEKLLLVVLNVFNIFLLIGLFWGSGRVTTAINISSDYVSTVVKWFYRLFAFINLTGNYTETLDDAKIAVGLRPSFLKALVRGKLAVVLSWIPQYIRLIKY